MNADEQAPSEGALAASVAAGDEAAFRSLYEATCRKAYGLCRRILGDAAAAEEAVIETYEQVWRQAARFDPARATLQGWVLLLARTRSIDQLRARARRLRHEQQLDAEMELPADRSPTPDLAGERAEDLGRVQAALLRLPREQRRAIEAAYFGGLSHTEVAAALGQPLGTVKTRIRDGLATLRVALDPGLRRPA